MLVHIQLMFMFSWPKTEKRINVREHWARALNFIFPELPGERSVGEEKPFFFCVCWSVLHRRLPLRLAREGSPWHSCANLREDHVRVCALCVCVCSFRHQHLYKISLSHLRGPLKNSTPGAAQKQPRRARSKSKSNSRARGPPALLWHVPAASLNHDPRWSYRI